MKKLITILFVGLLHNCFAGPILILEHVPLLMERGWGEASGNTYYISNEGSTGNNGTSASTTWPFSKVNSFSFSPGDNVYFKRGETFYGTVTISNSGSSGNPITYGAYGTGANPVITGFTTVSSWTNLGGNIWESTSAVSALSTCNMVAINGVNIAMGRFPNSGYFNIDSHSGSTTITSSSLSGATNWTGADEVIRKNHWILEKGTISSQSSTTLTYSDGSLYPVQNSFGFFIQNDARTLDVQNEWYYNPSTKKLRVYSTSTPTNVQLTTTDNLVYCNGKSYITFDNLDFEGSNSDALYIYNSGHINVANSKIYYSGVTGIAGKETTYLDVENNTIRYCNDLGINANSSNATILNNTVTSIGMIPGATQTYSFGNITSTGDNAIVQYNLTDSAGYCGILFRGNNTQIKNNFINNSCLIKDDGGGIYTGWTDTNREISDNIVLNSIGSSAGTDGSDLLAHGIYVDDGGAFISMLNNTIATSNGTGLFLHGAHDMRIAGNTIYNSKSTGFTKGAIFIQDYVARAVRNLDIKKNLLIGKTSDQLSFFYYDGSLDSSDIKLLGSMDSNYYARPIDDNLVLLIRSTTNGYPGRSFNLAGWKSFFGGDLHSHTSSKSVTSTDSLSFLYNATASDVTTSLPYKYIDVTGAIFDGSITLAPYSSAVLIQNGNKTGSVPPPTVTTSGNQTITATYTTIYSTPAAATGHTITSYQWTQTAGTAASITSPTSQNTGITGLALGTSTFKILITQDDGQTAYDYINVTVNSIAAPAIDAGNNQTLAHGSTVTLTASYTTASGYTATFNWVNETNGTGTFSAKTSYSTTVSGLADGTYRFGCTITQSDGQTAYDYVTITINAAPISPPIVSAGTDVSIQSPQSSVSLSGSVTPATGYTATYAWTKISGPGSQSIMYNTTLAPTITGLGIGTYVFRLTAYQSDGQIVYSEVTITVSPGGIIRKYYLRTRLYLKNKT